MMGFSQRSSPYLLFLLRQFSGRGLGEREIEDRCGRDFSLQTCRRGQHHDVGFRLLLGGHADFRERVAHWEGAGKKGTRTFS